MNLLKGKTINFIGDSITWGCDGSIWNGLVKEPYPKLIEKYFNCRCNNYGIDCSTISNISDPMFARLNKIDKNADITVIFGGVNDYFQQVNPENFGDAIQLIINTLKNKTKLIFVAPLCTSRKPITKGYHLIDYTITIVKKCIENNIPLIETGNKPFDLSNDYENRIYSGDNLHPNQEGYMFLAMYLGSKINEILINETW